MDMPDVYLLFNYVFSPSDVSALDYFHPSLSGQAKLASLTWQHSWWGSARRRGWKPDQAQVA
jgi:hypothetical protein